jgi:hypothetical protein
MGHKQRNERMRLFKLIGTCWFTFVFLFVAFEPSLQAAITMELIPSSPSPATLGTVITWTVNATDTRAGTLWYRFKAGPVHGNVKIVKDFSASNGFDWTTIDSEGIYIIAAEVKNNSTGEIAYASSAYEMLPLVDANVMISGTQNPLVFIYSAPPCTDGAMMQVQFWRLDGHGPAQTTQTQRCRSTSTMNFYLAGMEPNTSYTVQHFVTQNGQSTVGPTMSLTPGSVPSSIAGLSAANQTVLQASSAGGNDWILLQGPIGLPPFATDLDGNIIWYYPQPLTFLTRPDSSGRFFGINNTGTDASGSVLRVFDLAGNTIQETNAAAVNTQLAALGKRQIGVFHHEARRLSNGNIATLGTVEQILTDVQGPGPIDVVGDMIIVLDRNLQVVWTWDTFDYLDVTRQAILGETCSNSNACMSHFLARDGNDWTHANAVQQTPDGNLIISLRHQDWVVKIDYENGPGDGHILWHLGNAGDFTIESNDANVWFSHQHDPNFLGDNVTLELFDNGNTRRATDVNADSRGQVLVINEDNRTAALSLNQDLGVYSGALGSAQRLPNGDYHFDAGFIGASAISFEVTSAGGTMRAIQAGAVEYRTFRLRDLYSGVN